MGANETDFGGFGIVATTATPEEMAALFEQGERPGLSIARVSDTGGVKNPFKPLLPTVPFSLLPQSLFETNRWEYVDHGRWHYNEHITIGECRTVLKLVRRLSSFTSAHDSAVFSLQDNRPTAGAVAKGRSASFGLNRILRMKAAIRLAAKLRMILPWVESAKMPADQLSRLQ